MREPSKELIVVALGGNAILQPGDRGTADEQMKNIRQACHHLARLIEQGYRLVLTHGNGPQVGAILLQNEAAKAEVPSMPLDICGAQSQGFLGYLFQQAFAQELHALGIEQPVTTLVTQTLVDPEDPDFQDPSKPIGPFYGEAEARQLMAEKGYVMKEDAGRGWRRVVPSPDPIGIVERDAIRVLVDAGFVVIASGGGGVPVMRDAQGNLQGIEAVIDKDLAGNRLAQDVDADCFMILTDVPQVYLNFGTPEETALDMVTLDEARQYIDEGHFKAGSMKPKMGAAVRFAESHPRRRSFIADLDSAADALTGHAGTQVRH